MTPTKMALMYVVGSDCDETFLKSRKPSLVFGPPTMAPVKAFGQNNDSDDYYGSV